VAENLAQLVAFFSQSRLSRRKASTVVPQCIRELENTVAEWHTLQAGELYGQDNVSSQAWKLTERWLRNCGMRQGRAGAPTP
jgi:hypothetical protein